MLFPVHRPRIGLSIGLRHASLVQLTPTWSRVLLRRAPWASSRRSRTCTLPTDLVRLSHTRPNLSDPQALAGVLKELRGRRRGMLPVALTLPDPAARIALLGFEGLPQKPADLEALLRWRLQQECNLPAGSARLAYRVFRREAAAAGESPLQVLVAALHEEIYGQYADACVEAGFYPVTMGLASLQLFDLYRPTMEQALRSRGDQAGRDFFFLHHAEWGFAFFAFQDSSLQFIRIKAWPSVAESAGEEPQPVQADPRLTDEVRATFQFYTEAVRADGAADPRPVFLVSGVADGVSLLADRGTQVRIEALGLTLIPLADTDGEAASPAGPPPAVPPGELAALAGVWEG